MVLVTLNGLTAYYMWQDPLTSLSRLILFWKIHNRERQEWWMLETTITALEAQKYQYVISAIYYLNIKGIDPTGRHKQTGIPGTKSVYNHKIPELRKWPNLAYRKMYHYLQTNSIFATYFINPRNHTKKSYSLPKRFKKKKTKPASLPINLSFLESFLKIYRLGWRKVSQMRSKSKKIKIPIKKRNILKSRAVHYMYLIQ